MFFGESFSEKGFHEEVYLIDTVELFQVFTICSMLFSYLAEISESQTFDVLVFHNIIEGPLFPPVLDIPVHLVLGPLLYVFFVFRAIRVVAVFAELSLLLLELLSLGEHVRESTEH